MKKIRLLAIVGLLVVTACSDDNDVNPVVEEIEIESDFHILETTASVNEYNQLLMSIRTEGQAGATLPTPAGQMDGAPVMGYVFPTTLSAEDVGFGDVEGIVAMALTSHPDFDDTPLWDENNDQLYDNDGIIWHAHWVVLVNDDRVDGGLSVRELDLEDETLIVPPTHPGMPIYLDSPGFNVITKNDYIKVVIPVNRINNQRSFNFDGVTAFLRVNLSDVSLPTLGVYEVYDVASDDLSLPYQVN